MKRCKRKIYINLMEKINFIYKYHNLKQILFLYIPEKKFFF